MYFHDKRHSLITSSFDTELDLALFISRWGNSLVTAAQDCIKYRKKNRTNMHKVKQKINRKNAIFTKTIRYLQKTNVSMHNTVYIPVFKW